MTILINEINNIENLLFSKASDKEKFFYQYLSNKNIDVNIDELGEIDKICYAAFTNTRSEDLDKIVERNRKSKPVAGSHFSSNLITLCAFALYDKKIEETELKQFHSKNGFKEQFILFKVFGDSFLPTTNPVDTNISKLVNSVIVKKEYTEGVKNIIASLSNCNDLIELFLIKLTFLACAEIHPDKKIEENNKALITELTNFNSTLSKRIDKIVNWTIGIIILGLIPAIYYFIVKYWDSLSLEPHLAASGIVLPLSAAAIFLVFKFKKTWEELLANLKLKLVKRLYKRNNLDYDKVIKLIEITEN
jgi:hypothetical protein